tara:strand:- start:148715 stop:149053 length:339 start_codon:yes stop_codon:yes gene_type:complete
MSFASLEVDTNGVRVIQSNEQEPYPNEFKKVQDLNEDEQELYTACESYYPYQVREAVSNARERQASRIEKGHQPLPQSTDELRERGGCEDLIKVYVSMGHSANTILGIVFSR